MHNSSVILLKKGILQVLRTWVTAVEIRMLCQRETKLELLVMISLVLTLLQWEDKAKNEDIWTEAAALPTVDLTEEFKRFEKT